MFGIIVQQGQRLGQKTELHVFLLTAGPEFCLALPTIAVDDVHHLSELSMGSVRTADVLWKASDDELVEERESSHRKRHWTSVISRTSDKRPFRLRLCGVGVNQKL